MVLARDEGGIRERRSGGKPEGICLFMALSTTDPTQMQQKTQLWSKRWVVGSKSQGYLGALLCYN